jgi:hypothetical protein
MVKVICLLAVLSVAACSGGGSSSGSTAAPSSSSSAPPQSASPSNQPGGQSASGATQVLTLQDGGTLTLNGDGSGVFRPVSGGFSFAPLNGPAPSDTQSFGGTKLYAQGTGGSPTASIELMSSAAGLSASEFGAWKSYDGNGNVTATNFFAGGRPTPVSAIPLPGSGITGTYNGSYVGTENITGQAITPISGSSQIIANFSTGAVTANFSGGPFDIITGHVPTTMTPGANTYTAQGNTFSAFQAGNYTIKGGFYGTPATGQAPPETVGTFSGSLGRPGAVVVAPGAPINATFSGSFGAHL